MASTRVGPKRVHASRRHLPLGWSPGFPRKLISGKICRVSEHQWPQTFGSARLYPTLARPPRPGDDLLAAQGDVVFQPHSRTPPHPRQYDDRGSRRPALILFDGEVTNNPVGMLRSTARRVYFTETNQGILCVLMPRRQMATPL